MLREEVPERVDDATEVAVDVRVDRLERCVQEDGGAVVPPENLVRQRDHADHLEIPGTVEVRLDVDVADWRTAAASALIRLTAAAKRCDASPFAGSINHRRRQEGNPRLAAAGDREVVVTGTAFSIDQASSGRTAAARAIATPRTTCRRYRTRDDDAREDGDLGRRPAERHQCDGRGYRGEPGGRAWSTGAASWLAAVGAGVALMTLCRPASQVAVLACVVVPFVVVRSRRQVVRGVAIALAAAVLPLLAWSMLNAVRYDDFTVARGSKAWVPFFRVAGDIDPANGDASRRLAAAVERNVLTLPPYASRHVDVQTYFDGAGNLEVIRMIALSDQVFGWDDDYAVLLDASLEAIHADVDGYLRGVVDTFWDFLSQHYAPEVRERPVPIPAQPAELTVDGKPFPAPITVSPVVQAVRYGFVWCPTDDLERCVVHDPVAALGSRSEAERYDELVDTIRDWNAQLPTRDSNATLASKGGTASDRWPRPFLWIAVAALALAIRRPRGAAPILVVGGVAAVVLLVHALSQAPQSEFELPFVPVWIVAAIVGLLAPRAACVDP